ncbi:MAG: DUF3606 domain-containing protein [Pedobacter sp.]|nr:MAG: DUF3606 domain-containing protein [Pedobacter sp.]
MEKIKEQYKQEVLIDIDKAYELWDWAAKFKVSAETLKKAVREVGNRETAVRIFLKK